MPADPLEKDLAAVLERIDRAARAAGRAPGSVRLVAVTKTQEPPVAAALVRLGAGELGESRAAELERKHAALAEQGLAPRWHFLGRVQRNKARRVALLADEIHSVDGLRLLETLARLADELGRRPLLWLQAHLSGESAKQGFPPEELGGALERAVALGLPVAGLMTMAPLAGSERPEESARPVFAALARLRRELPAASFAGGRPLLSMGMSGDFEAAIAEGADVVRVGSALFRSPSPGAPPDGAGARERLS